jgi:hypothetical protein
MTPLARQNRTALKLMELLVVILAKRTPVGDPLSGAQV